ncbi:serine/threonine-protein phosphatase rdgC-like protein [Anopheles sinensis]|uniref:Serine/threonine-protein phosphatase rdgC-like protein n=1 Tax=Anopheles sinensis TaxID=74873 RepID=A0A084WND6_ANOSI|nr:serine/threonine-protein phosphatase rdgC-like protein [Anopheles sinensis]
MPKRFGSVAAPKKTTVCERNTKETPSWARVVSQELSPMFVQANPGMVPFPRCHHSSLDIMSAMTELASDAAELVVVVQFMLIMMLAGG